jgi:hypothetical protein
MRLSREELAVDFANFGRSLASGPLRCVGRLLVVVAIALTASTLADAEEPTPKALEYRVKAGFLFNFAKYVEWPAGTFGSATNAVVICILGKDPFGAMLDSSVAGKRVEGRSVVVQRFHSIKEITTCHILFVSASEKDRLTDIQAHLRSSSILTVSDLDEFLEHGGQIRFVTEENRVKFDVNLKATRQAGLKLDANLLRVARRVIRSPGDGGAD